MLENKKILNEVSDEDLETIAGGGTYNKEGFLKTTGGYSCDHYECKYCGEHTDHRHSLPNGEVGYTPIGKACRTCIWHTTLRCGNPANKR